MCVYIACDGLTPCVCVCVCVCMYICVEGERETDRYTERDRDRQRERDTYYGLGFTLTRNALKPAELAMVEASVQAAVAQALPVYNQVHIY